MFCDKTNVNILTSILLQSGITDAVVCPGSRNGVIVHNLHELTRTASPEHPFRIHAVTDERSAAFVALGISLAQDLRPVAVCVTSGSALLNTIPAVAEAFYRQIPLLVISADRPPQLIGQLDGQTIPQTSALAPYAKTYTLAEAHTEAEAHWCRNAACEACIALKRRGGGPVHLNVPLSEPLFSFTTPRLPSASPVAFYETEDGAPPAALVSKINEATLPVVIVGQCERKADILKRLDEENKLLVLPELVSNQANAHRTALLESSPELREQLRPDLLIHVGGNLVGKQLKLALRQRPALSVVRIQQNAGMPDTFMHLDMLVEAPWQNLLARLRPLLRGKTAVCRLRQQLDNAPYAIPAADIQHTAMTAIKRHLQQHRLPLSAIHLANSTVVRSAAAVFNDGTFTLRVNRGVNGIEGSLSAAAGNALASRKTVLAFIGDLSFFYDQNALWNSALRGNLRIVLFNNSGGRIFKHLPGLNDSPASNSYIAGAHHTSARGVAETHRLEYLSAVSLDDLPSAINRLLTQEAERPVLLEIFC